MCHSIHRAPRRRASQLKSYTSLTIAAVLIAGCGEKPKATDSNAATTSAATSPVAESNVKTHEKSFGDKQADDSNGKPAGPQLIAPAGNPASAPSDKAKAEPEKHTAFYRADPTPPKMPKVILSMQEESLCKVRVRDAMPSLELPKVDGDGKAKLASLLGKKGTVVIFWHGDERMTREQLADVAPDIIEPFAKDGVEVVGIAVKESAADATAALKTSDAKFTNLIDADGKAFAQIGSDRLPRTYLLDPSGKVVWFDLGYSHATRRELHEALRTLTESK